jgi:hypothetical protein
MDWQQLSALQRDRFADLQLDCGKRSDPGIRDREEWSDWSAFGTTAGELLIEDYLDRLGTRNKSILHIGIGNSGLAERFARSASQIVGTTIAVAEVSTAQSLGLSNYRAILHNKYSGTDDGIPADFDFVIDSNPTAFCCCMTHLGSMLDFYASRLADEGQLITERSGLAWQMKAPGAHERWGFSFDDLAAVARLAGLDSYRVSEDIYVLARSRPSMPTFASQTSYYLRKFSRKLWRIVTLRGKLLGK